jgi:hypothetical protein
VAPSSNQTQVKHFSLPVDVISAHDVTNLIKELDEIDSFFMQVKLRRGGTSVELPKLTSVMENLLNYNGLNLLKEADRTKLKLILQTVRTQAPVLHFSFSSDPPRRFLEKLIAWVRAEINPLALIQIGLQPNIGAGFTLRTVNHFFDLTLKKHLDASSDLLLKEIRESNDN